MTYQEAMKEVGQVGAGKVVELALLAMTITTLRNGGHKGVDPEIWYDSAKNLGLTSSDILKMVREDPARWGFLPWESGAAPNALNDVSE